MNFLPDVSAMNVIGKARGSASIYEKYRDETAIIVLHDGRIVVPEKVYNHLGRPLHIKILEGDGWLVFEGGDEYDFTVQGGGKRGTPCLHCTGAAKGAGLVKAGFKAIYDVTLKDGRVYLNCAAPALEYIKHTRIARKRRG
ncbi:MAG: hypothetical protein GY841_10200 [FCB group bacterium]|nr:hypothetical protein [FCB group bacterium]